VRDRVATLLMVLARLGALASFVGAIGAVAKAGPDTIVVESWRMLGFLVFAGIFALLAFRPRTLPGLWELSIMHKAGMALIAAVAATGDAKDAVSTAVADGVLAALLVTAYVLARGFTAWRKPSAAASSQL
jgi:multisubunit Na+/H+ antiporter MnhC subunit